MNIKNFIFGSIALFIGVGTVFFVMSSQKESVYNSRENILAKGVEGRLEYLQMIREDPKTGIVDQNLVNQAKNEIFARMKQKNKASIGLNWKQMGPDNVGGRTRAILIDKDQPNTVYAGSVAGGLFISTDGTQTWTPVDGHQGLNGENLMVSSITQTDEGRVFFSTGSTFREPYIGNGLYEYVPSTNKVVPILTETTSLPNNNAGTLSQMNVVRSKGNRLYIGTKLGFYYADPVSTQYPSALSGWTNPISIDVGGNSIKEEATVQDIAIGSDGAIIVCLSGSKVYTSNDGISFTRLTSAGNAGRYNVAIAPSDPNIYYLLRTTNTLNGVDISFDKGANWSTIVPGGSPCIDPCRQLDCGDNGQCDYDACIAVDPSDWGHILVGGVQMYEWKYNPGSVPVGGSWLKATTLFGSLFNRNYVHADKHTIVWPDANTIYVGTDGGVSRSVDGGFTYQQRNFGYNVTTFYDVNIAANGYFMGGSQDNGSQLFTNGDFGELTPLGTTDILGGDGFDCAFSNFADGIQYATSQFGVVRRFVTGGGAGSFTSPELRNIISGQQQPFYTSIENWETKNDPLSIDSIDLIFDSIATTIYGRQLNNDSIVAGDTIFAGTTLTYQSLSNSAELKYTVPSDIILNYPIDTVRLVDPIQNKFALATTAGIFLTRDAARLNALEPKWFKILEGSSNLTTLEFSADGNHLFVGRSNGGIWRISNLSMGNTFNALDISNTVTSSGDPDMDRVTTVTKIADFPNVVTGIASDPNDNENLIVTLANYNSNDHVYRSVNAISATGLNGNFTSIQGSLPMMPVLDAEIDYSDKDKVIIGTEWGVWTTDNAFSASGAAVEWTDESGPGMAHVPVTSVKQQHLSSYESVNSGYVYLGTYGRGFYKSEDLFVLSVDEDKIDGPKEKEGFVSNLNIYPNPLNNFGMVSFDLNQNSEATINIYNLNGSLVKTITLDEKNKGNHKVKFDVSDLSVGSYILSLESDMERSIGKFIVTR